MLDDFDATAEPPPTELLATFANARRRCVLRCLGRSPPLSLAELARDVDGVEADGVDDRYAVEETDASRIELDLYHCHLPALDDTGLVRYDTDDGMVAITPEGSAVAAWLGERADATQPAGCD